MCGSNNLLKQDGVFVCQNCLTKYTVEEAKKIMLGGDVTISIDTSKKEQSLIDLAESQMKADNYGDAYDTASQLIELNSNLWQGWAYKAISLSHISKKAGFQFNETLVCFEKAYGILKQQDETTATEVITKYATESLICLFKRHCELFVSNVSKRSADNMSEIYETYIKEANKMPEKYMTNKVSVYNLENKLGSLFLTYLKAASKIANKSFEMSNKNEARYQVWSNECLIIMTKLIYLMNKDIALSTVEEGYDFLTKIIQKQLDVKYFGYSILFKDYSKTCHISRANKKFLTDTFVVMKLKKDQIVEKAKQREETISKLNS